MKKTKLTPKLERQIFLHLPIEFHDWVFKKATSKSQRDQIDWYLLSLAIQASKDGNDQEMYLFIDRFKDEQIRKLIK